MREREARRGGAADAPPACTSGPVGREGLLAESRGAFWPHLGTFLYENGRFPA